MAKKYDHFSDIQQAVNAGRIQWSGHCLKRMMERGINRAVVKSAIMTGRIIENHPNLLVATFEPQPLHVAVAYSELDNICHIITVYYPDLEHFETDLMTRKFS